MQVTTRKSWRHMDLPSEGITTLVLELVADNKRDHIVLQRLYDSVADEYNTDDSFANTLVPKIFNKSQSGVKKLVLGFNFSHHSKENREFFESL